MLNTNPTVKIEYKVREVKKFFVTRYIEYQDGQSQSDTRGCEYDNAAVAHEVAYALCKTEHDALAWPPGDMRICYPPKPLTEAIPA